MRIEEIRKILNNTKVYVDGKSREIQEKLFAFGYRWGFNHIKVSFEEMPFLYINKNSKLTYGNDMPYFKEHEYREISADKILSIEITLPSYRPFKNRDECWEEMQKHSPFGWLYHKVCNCYAPIRVNIEDSIDFENFFNLYTFADGTPFGILEK